MKNAILIFVLFLSINAANAGVLDGKRLTDGTLHKYHLALPMPDGGYLIAPREDDTLQTVVRLDADGELMWAQDFTNLSKLRLGDAVCHADGSVSLLYNGTNAQTNPSYMLMRLSASGNIDWVDGLNVPWVYGLPGGTVMKALPDGGVLVTPLTADFLGGIRVDAQGAVTGSVIITPDSAIGRYSPSFDAELAPDSGFILAGRNGPNALILRANPSGGVAWAVHYGNAGYNQPRSITRTSDGGYLVAGLYYTPADYNYQQGFLLKISATGSIVWRKFYTSGASYTTDLDFNQVIENSDGTILVTGKFTGIAPIPQSYSFHFSKFSATGEPLSTYRIQAPNSYNQRLYPHLYKNAGGETIIGANEFMSSYLKAPNFPVVMSLTQLPSVCLARTATLTEITEPATNNLPTGTFTLHTLSTVTHPVIVGRNSQVTFTAQELCSAITTGINDIAINTPVSLFPNPAINGSNVIIKAPVEVQLKSALLFDINGRLLLQAETRGGSNITFSTNGLPAGVYFVQVVSTSNERLPVQKLVVAE